MSMYEGHDRRQKQTFEKETNSVWRTIDMQYLDSNGANPHRSIIECDGKVHRRTIIKRDGTPVSVGDIFPCDGVHNPIFED